MTVTATKHEHKPSCGNCRWIVKPGPDGSGVLQIESQTKRGIVCADYNVDEIREAGATVGYRLTNQANGKVYDIDTTSPSGIWQCDCPDYYFRQERTGCECKHARALKAALSRVQAEPVSESKPEPKAQPKPPYVVSPVFRCDAPSARFTSSVKAEQWSLRTARKHRVPMVVYLILENGRSRKLVTARPE